jgi:prolyl-tRNA editing enzyme YbaK/EbsC (Cys-tRNA(Pro) deacylase)
VTPTQRVLAVLTAQGIHDPVVREFEESTATAADAAAAIGTTLGQIVKSLVFLSGDEPIMVLVSGSNRVDTRRLAARAGASIKRADADLVRRVTGFPIGGVPPVGHVNLLETYIDRDLLQYPEVWASAGTPTSVFAIEPSRLVHITWGHVADLATDGPQSR